MIIGLLLNKSFPIYDAVTVDVSFWRPGPFYIDPETKSGWMKWRGFKDRATFQANVRSFYNPATIMFSFNPSNWPFVPGTDPMTKFWAFVKSHTDIVDSDGNEINGGLDWSQAVDDTV